MHGSGGTIRVRGTGARATAARCRSGPWRQVHDGVAQAKEGVARQRFSKEVGHVGRGGDEGRDQLLVLHQLAN
eukprot:4047980-Prymnesium_polylepis.1